MKAINIYSALALLGLISVSGCMENKPQNKEAAVEVNPREIVVQMTDLQTGEGAGTITVTENEYGTLFTPNLSGIKPGLHGFHLHQNPSCATTDLNGKTVVGGAAGGHYDPQKTGKHGSPWTNDNHLGDLPALFVDSNGDVKHPVLAPRVKVDDLDGRAVMIHVGGDNYSDHPLPLGGGGARLICGVVPA